MGIEDLDRYRPFLDEHTRTATDTEVMGGPVASRYETMRFCFEHFLERGGRTIVELGTIRSFVHGGLSGCNSDDPSLFDPTRPDTWDWGAGCFSMMAATCLAEAGPRIHTVDIVPAHIERCRVVTARYAELFEYHVADSVEFLRSFPAGSIDLLYLDTGDMWPIEPAARHQLREAEAIKRCRVMARDGLVLIDDVKNATPMRNGDMSRLGKSKYSLPYLTGRGRFKVVRDGYQVVLARRPSGAARLLRAVKWQRGMGPNPEEKGTLPLA